MKKIKNILVTGGLGFIGSHLVDKLVKKNYKVFVIDDLSTGLKKNRNTKAKYYFIDINHFIKDNKKLKKIINGKDIDVIFHLAANASVNASLNNPNLMFQVNFNASISIIEACKETNVKKFIFASTSAVYGEPTFLPVNESHITNPISPYGLSKLMFEEYTRYFSQSNNLSIVNFRLPNVYGKRQRPDLEGGVIAIFIDRMKENSIINIFGDGKQKRDWVHVNDIVNAFEKSLKYNFDNEIISLGSLKSNTVNKLFSILKSQLDYKKKPNYLSKRDGDIKFMIMDNKKAFKLLKWKPLIELSKGLKLID